MDEIDLDFGGDILSVTDEDGNEFELEVLDETEYRDARYLAAVDANLPEDSEDGEVIILKVITDPETGEELLSTPDSDEEFQAVFQIFLEQMFDDEADE